MAAMGAFRAGEEGNDVLILADRLFIAIVAVVRLMRYLSRDTVDIPSYVYAIEIANLFGERELIT